MSLAVQKTSASAHSYSLTPNTGRNSKTFKSRVLLEAGNASDNAETTYLQAGKDEFIQLISAVSRTIGKSATSLEIELVSNSTKINAQFLNNGLDASIDSITVNGNAYTNNSTITGDPGADAQFTVIITLSFKANNMAVERSFSMQISDNAGHAVITNGTQEADTPSVTVTPSSVNVPATGGTGTIMVSANGPWTVSVVDLAQQVIQNEES